MTSTTKSGSDQFHGLASDYFQYQNMFGVTEFMAPPNNKYHPFHSNNFSGSIGGPIIPHKQFFFFFSVEPLRSSAATGGSTLNFPDSEFAAFAQANFPDNFGPNVLNTSAPTGQTGRPVSHAG